MDFDYSPKTKELQAKLNQFMHDYIYPAEALVEKELLENTQNNKRWTPLQTIEELKKKAKEQGLWNLFLPVDSAAAAGVEGAGLTNQEYAPLAEIMGRVPWSSEVFNCSAPDTGNMETIARYGSEENRERWLKPLLILFTAAGAPETLQNEVFKTADFEKWSKKNVILVRLDLSDPNIDSEVREQNLRLKNAFGIEEIPQVCFSEVTSRKGKTNFNKLGLIELAGKKITLKEIGKLKKMAE